MKKKKKNQGVVVARQAQLMHSIRIREAEERKKKRRLEHEWSTTGRPMIEIVARVQN
jgi:hypothetical protein